MTNRSFKIDGFLGVILLVAFFVGIFFVLKGLFFVMQYVAPALLVAALIIDYTVVVNHFKWLIATLKSNLLFGIGAVLFTVFGYMVVFPYLFAKALFKKKIREVAQEIEKKQEGEFVDYEEISSKPKKEEILELPKLERKERKGNDYENMFD